MDDFTPIDLPFFLGHVMDGHRYKLVIDIVHIFITVSPELVLDRDADSCS